MSAAGAQIATCSSTWCRATVNAGDGVRMDLMHPDGTARRRIAAGDTAAAITDVAPLDRFVLLTEPGSGASGTARLLAYDIATGRTVDISPDVSNADYRDGILWWSTGAGAPVSWHTLDLRTV